MGRGSGLLFNRARNSTIKSRFYLIARKRHLSGPGVAELMAEHGCAHADDPRGLCPACRAMAAQRAEAETLAPSDDDNRLE